MSNKRGIPELRDRIYEIAEETQNDELHQIAEEMFRRPPRKRAAPRSQKLTPELAQEIREYSAKHPDAHHQDVAEVFGVNHGRISEALNHEV